MDLTGIFFHDLEITRVIEETQASDLVMEIEYPTDWDDNVYEPRRLVFRDVLEYEVHEGPFHGPPTILSVSEIRQENERSLLRIDTNAGFRQLLCKKVELLPAVETV